MSIRSKDAKAIKTVDPSLLISHIADAGDGYRHAEVIVQQRLYNFLMAASILLLASAATLSVSATTARSIFVITDSTLGFFLSCAFAILGKREHKFIDLHMEIVRNLEKQITHEQFLSWELVAKLRDGQEVILPFSGKPVQLRKWEFKMRSSNILISAPIAFAIVFLVVSVIACTSWSGASGG